MSCGEEGMFKGYSAAAVFSYSRGSVGMASFGEFMASTAQPPSLDSCCGGPSWGSLEPYQGSDFIMPQAHMEYARSRLQPQRDHLAQGRNQIFLYGPKTKTGYSVLEEKPEVVYLSGTDSGSGSLTDRAQYSTWEIEQKKVNDLFREKMQGLMPRDIMRDFAGGLFYRPAMETVPTDYGFALDYGSSQIMQNAPQIVQEQDELLTLIRQDLEFLKQEKAKQTNFEYQ